jgi:eukaryotic-like serine/threonine-protein kinase
MSEQEETHLAPGYRLDRYELLCPLGIGGMASVWVARLLGKHGFEKLVAIKTILPRYARDPSFQEMFLDEARIAARIQHVNVAQILDLGDQHGVLFLAMEWVDGDALSKLAHAVEARGAAFPPGIAMRILVDVCAGLHAAHELRDRGGVPLEIVHRDISPHNILVGVQGTAKVIDFGIAKARDRAAGDTRTGSFKGKVKYMAPEQAVSPKTTDRRADVWAVGAVLYSLLARRSPYESDNDMATLMQLALQKPPQPLPPSIPEPIRTVVSRALTWAPGDRHATAAELGEALEGAMSASGMLTTSADVAAFCADHLAARLEARQRAVAIALSAAEERSRVALLLTPEERSNPRVVRPSPPKTAMPDEQAARPSDGHAEVVAAAPETSPTLGAASTMTLTPPGALRRRGVAVAAGAMGLSLAALVVALVHRGGDSSPTMGATSVASVPVAAATSAPTVVPIAEQPLAPSSAAAPAPAVPPLSPRSAPSSTRPTPAGRRRVSPSAPTTHPQATPAPSGAATHRGEYGF